LALVFAGSRLAWLWWNPGSTAYWEESYRLIAAREILEGAAQPLLDYQADHYQGGSLVIILLASGFFGVFGESVATLKLSALSFGAGILTLLYATARVWFGRAPAVIAGSAYCAGPPLLAASGLVTMGSHGESAFFTLAQFFVFLGVLSGRWRSPAGWAALGVVSGLGLWFCFTTGLGLAACALTWLLLEKLPRPRELFAAILGGAAGLTPWILYNLTHDFAGIGRILEIFGLRDPVDAWIDPGVRLKLLDLLGTQLPEGLASPYDPPDSGALRLVLAGACSLPLALGFAFAAWRIAPTIRDSIFGNPRDGGERREVLLVVYPIVFLIGYLASDFVVEVNRNAHAYRLFLPFTVGLVLVSSVAAARALALGGVARAVAAVALLTFLLGSGFGTLRVAARPVEDQQTLGTQEGYNIWGVLLHRKFEPDLSGAIRAAGRMRSRELQFRVLQGIGWGLEFRFEKSGELQEIVDQLRGLPLEERAPIVLGLLWSSQGRQHTLTQQILAGDEREYPRRAFHRLRRLESMAREEWESLPESLRKEPKESFSYSR
jgi:hypothetical protein